MNTWQSEPASFQQLRCFKGLSSSDSSHIPRTPPSAWAPKSRSLTTSLSVRVPLISSWEFSSTDALSSGNSYFTKWYNYAWSLATVSNSLRYNNSLPSQEERTPKSLFPSPAYTDRAKSNWVWHGCWQHGPHVRKWEKVLAPQSDSNTRPNKTLLAELSASRPSWGLSRAATGSEHEKDGIMMDIPQ